MIWGGEIAGKAVCAAVGPLRVGEVAAFAGCRQAGRLEGAAASGPGFCWPPGQASTHVPFWQARPRLMRLRRFRAAVRFFSHALLRAVPR